MYFDEMFNALTVSERQDFVGQCLLNNLSENNLNKLLDINLRYNSKVEEIRVSEEHFLFWSKGALGYSSITIIPLDEIEYCYYSEHISNVNEFYFGFILKNGKKQEFSFMHNKQLRPIFEKIHSRISDKSTAACNCSLNSESNAHIFKDLKGSYHINENQIYLITKKTFLKKETTKLIIPNIQDIIWCYQWYENDDNVDFHTLSLYLSKSKEPVNLQFNGFSANSVFEVVLAIKAMVPHLLYGPSQEYEKIFKRNPEELMVIAKSKISK